MMTTITDLRHIFERAVARCDPATLAFEHLAASPLQAAEVDVLTLGKCAAGLLEGIARAVKVDRAMAAIPRGYRLEGNFPAGTETSIGGHPDMTPESFESGRRALAFVRSSERPLLFAISGGGSAAVELPLVPWFTEDDLVRANRLLITAGITIGEINIVRRHLSAIKGGRLAAAARRPLATLVYSDVASGRLADVASGPTLGDPSTLADAADILERLGGPFAHSLALILRSGEVPETPKRDPAPAACVADNRTLVHTAAAEATALGWSPVLNEAQIESDVERAAAHLFSEARRLKSGKLLVAGGEPTVRVVGPGRGGRCSELAVRLLRMAAEGHEPLAILFASSDGQDGNSGAAGVALEIEPALARLDREAISAALAASASFELLQGVADPIMIPASGNNLRDLFLLAHG